MSSQSKLGNFRISTIPWLELKLLLFLLLLLPERIEPSSVGLMQRHGDRIVMTI